MENSNVKIQVFGSGCPTCKKLFELTKQAVQELGIETEVEHVTDIQKLLELGVMSSPVLVVNDKVMVAGSVSSQEKIKELITAGMGSTQINTEAPKKSGGCSCGSGCC